MKPARLTTCQLEKLLETFPGRSQILTLVARTRPVLIGGRANPLAAAGLVKLARVNGIANFKYGSSVNRQREREQHPELFRPQPRTWGTRREKTPLIDHAGRVYLELQVIRTYQTQYRTDDGRIVPTDQATAAIRQPTPPATQGLQRPVQLRDYDLRNILQISLAGQLYHTEACPC